MIENMSYEQILEIASSLQQNSEIISSLIKDKGATELEDFASTVEGYSKYLQTTIELNKDADKALEILKNTKK